MSYALAIGYPLRLIIAKDQSLKVEIELHDRRIWLENQCAALWSRLYQLEDVPDESCFLVEELKQQGVVVVGRTAAALLLSMADCTPVRQGLCAPDDIGHNTLWLGEKSFFPTPFQEQIWLAADGAVPLSTLLDQIMTGWRDAQEAQKREILEELLALTAEELCYFR